MTSIFRRSSLQVNAAGNPLAWLPNLEPRVLRLLGQRRRAAELSAGDWVTSPGRLSGYQFASGRPRKNVTSKARPPG